VALAIIFKTRPIITTQFDLLSTVIDCPPGGFDQLGESYLNKGNEPAGLLTLSYHFSDTSSCFVPEQEARQISESVHLFYRFITTLDDFQLPAKKSGKNRIHYRIFGIFVDVRNNLGALPETFLSSSGKDAVHSGHGQASFPLEPLLQETLHSKFRHRVYAYLTQQLQRELILYDAMTPSDPIPPLQPHTRALAIRNWLAECRIHFLQVKILEFLRNRDSINILSQHQRRRSEHSSHL
jgi:hypothetical protein